MYATAQKKEIEESPFDIRQFYRTAMDLVELSSQIKLLEKQIGEMKRGDRDRRTLLMLLGTLQKIEELLCEDYSIRWQSPRKE